MALIKVEDDDDFKLQYPEDTSTSVFLYFTASWCGPCKQIAPLIEEMAKKYGDKVKVLKVDIDDCAETADEFKVSSVPYFILMDEGKPVETIKGANEDEVKRVFERFNE